MKTLREYFEETEVKVVKEGNRYYIDLGDTDAETAEKIVEAMIAEAKKKKPDADGDGVPDWADKKDGDDKEETKESVEADTYVNKSLEDLRRLAGMDSITNKAEWTEYKPKSE